MAEKDVQNAGEVPEPQPAEEVVSEATPQTGVQSLNEAELEKIQQAAESKAWEKYQGMQRTLAKEQEKRRELETRLNQPSGLNRQTLDVLENMAKSDPYNTDIQTQIQSLKAEANRLEQIQRAEQFVNTEREKLTQTIQEAFPDKDPNDEEFEPVWGEFRFAQYVSGPDGLQEAYKKLDRIKSKATPKTANPPKGEKPQGETEAQVRERIEREVLEKHGLLKGDTTTPSGGGQGKKPTLEQLQASNPMETMKKVDSGEWVL